MAYRPSPPGVYPIKTVPPKAKPVTGQPNPTFTVDSGNPQSGFGQPATGVAPPPTPPKPGVSAPGGTQAPSAYDTSSDPILQQILAMNEKARAIAQGNALASLGDAAIQYGDASGLGLDATKEQAARDNPFSILANEKRQYGQQNTQLEDSLNKQNLFYSGARGTQLGQLATGYQQNLAGDADRFRALVTDINRGKASALMAADQSDIAGRQDAASRAQAQALQYGYDPGAGSSVGAEITPSSPAAVNLGVLAAKAAGGSPVVPVVAPKKKPVAKNKLPLGALF